jgi:hypothetical protein
MKVSVGGKSPNPSFLEQDCIERRKQDVTHRPLKPSRPLSSIFRPLNKIKPVPDRQSQSSFQVRRIFEREFASEVAGVATQHDCVKKEGFVGGENYQDVTACTVREAGER